MQPHEPYLFSTVIEIGISRHRHGNNELPVVVAMIYKPVDGSSVWEMGVLERKASSGLETGGPKTKLWA
jgi:hypothetical protein